MTHVGASVRVTSIHFDYATWHAHLAARGAPSRLLFVPRHGRERARPGTAGTGRLIHLDLAAWQARLAGSTRVAA
jgi:hypothetical protein